MANTLKWTAEEDAILVATAGLKAEETNHRLTEAGFGPRSAAEIKNRRHYIRHNSQGGSMAGKAHRLDVLRTEMDQLELRLADLRGQYEEVKAELLSDL